MSENIQKKLEERHRERLARFEQRRQVRLKGKTETQQSCDSFLENFSNEKRAITAKLNSLSRNVDKMAVDKAAAAGRFDEVSEKLLTLQKYVSDSTGFLPSYTLHRAQDILRKLRNEINNRREMYMPKKKFGFKSRQKAKIDNSVKEPSNANIKPEIDDIIKTNQFSDILGFSNKKGETLELSYEKSKFKDIDLNNLENCTVNIVGHPSALRMKGLIDCKIYCGPVSQAVFINECFDSEFHVACQQLRIHSTSNSNFYIHVTSKAIIEDCENVGFATYDFTYDNIEKHFEDARLNMTINNWRDVDDFDWLKLDEQSPNWYILTS